MSNVRLFILYIQWVLFGRRSVILCDTDGELNARLVRGMGACCQAKRYGLGVRTVRLLPGGKICGAAYVKGWEPLFPPTFDVSASVHSKIPTKEGTGP